MRFSQQDLSREATATGFGAEPLEKVLQLLVLLSAAAARGRARAIAAPDRLAGCRPRLAHGHDGGAVGIDVCCRTFPTPYNAHP